MPRPAFGLLSTVIGAKGYFPDFLTTSPTWDVGPDDEIDRIRLVPPDVLAKMVDRSRGRRRVVLSALRDDPTGTRARIADGPARPPRSPGSATSPFPPPPTTSASCAAALISSRRAGHQVLHSCTPLGDTLAGT